MSTTSADPLPSSFAAFADGLSEPSQRCASRSPQPGAAPNRRRCRRSSHRRAPCQAARPRKPRNSPTASPSSCASASTGGRAGLVQGLLQEYALSSQEGVALMCLAEALLRIPDADDARRADPRQDRARASGSRTWASSPSLFVNAATWGLLLTGKLVATHSETSLSAVAHAA